MFEEKKVKILEKKNRELSDENNGLRKQISQLNKQLRELQTVVDAADNYREEHQKAMFVLSESKTKYELLYKEMLKTKKEYEKRMNEILKAFE